MENLPQIKICWTFEEQKSLLLSDAEVFFYLRMRSDLSVMTLVTDTNVSPENGLFPLAHRRDPLVSHPSNHVDRTDGVDGQGVAPSRFGNNLGTLLSVITSFLQDNTRKLLHWAS